MVRVSVRWTEKALDQLHEIGAYIALENVDAAMQVIQRVQEAVDRLEEFPESGRKVPEFPRLPHREVVAPPCRVFYRVQDEIAWVVFVIRSERIIRKSYLSN